MTESRELTARGARTAYNLGVYSLSQVFNAGLALVLLGILTRSLGRSGFGEFSFAFVVASMGALLADFGLGPWLTRSVAQTPGDSRSLLSNVLRTRIILVVASGILVLATCALYLRDADRLANIALMLVYVTGNGYVAIFESLLMGQQRAGRVSISVLLGKIFELGFVLALLAWRGTLDVREAIAAMAVASLLRVVLARLLSGLALASTSPGAPAFRTAGGPSRSALIREAIPFAVGAIVWTAYFKVDVLLLERLTVPEKLGLYTAAYRVLEALLLIPRSVVGVSYPVISAAWTGTALEGGILTRPARGLVAVGLAAAAGLWVTSGEALNFLFGPQFVAGSDALKILALALTPVFLNQMLGMVFSATHRQGEWVRVVAIALGVNIAANAVLIPALDITGAALATLLSESLTLVVLYRVISRRHGALFSPMWLVRALTVAALTGAAARLSPFPFIVTISLGALVFVLLALVLRVWTEDDRAFVMTLARRAFGGSHHPAPSPDQSVPPSPGVGADGLSVVVLTMNSAETLGATLESASFSEDLLIVDSGSTDDTIEIARRFGARVLSRAITDWSDQRNAGLRAATGRWVLFLDSDEVLDPELIRSIKSVVFRPDRDEDPAGYELLVRNYFLGRPLLHGGLENDYHLRLARTGACRWEGAVHERMIVDGRVTRLPGLVHHYTGRSLSQRMEKTRTYAQVRAHDLRLEGRRFSLWAAVWQPMRFFLGRVLIRGGYRDGLHGIVWWWLLSTELLLVHFFLAIPEAESFGNREKGSPESNSRDPEAELIEKSTRQ